MRNPPREKSSENNNSKFKYFAYFRKSTESDERQVQSIPDQEAWADGVIVRDGLSVKQVLQESMSARNPGRPVFDEMLERIEAGEAEGLIAYDPSRLARNAIDGARIIQLIDSGKLKRMVFANFVFENNSMGKFMLGFFFAQSKLYTDNLSEVVTRGMKSKASKGVYPGWAKHGYINHPQTKEIIPDPDKFHLIERAYKLYATNRYGLINISDMVFKLGFTNRSGGKLSMRQVADLLTDPFYYGAFVWGKEIYQGIHKPAVSKNLWDKVQVVYKDRGRPKSKWSNDKVFCGLLRCGECGASITAERHSKRQKNGNVHTWLYYRCTKKRDANCSQRYLREESLIEQLKTGALEISIPDDFAVPMLEQIEKWEVAETSRVSEQSVSLRKESGEIEAKLRRLNDLAVDGEINREDYASRKKKLVNEKIATESRIKVIAHEGDMYWLEPLKNFVTRLWERNLREAVGDPLKLRDLLAEGGSNLLMKSQKVLWNWNSPYEILASRGVCSTWWS